MSGFSSFDKVVAEPHVTERPLWQRALPLEESSMCLLL